MRKLMELVHKFTSWDLFFELIALLALVVIGVVAYCTSR